MMNKKPERVRWIPLQAESTPQTGNYKSIINIKLYDYE